MKIVVLNGSPHQNGTTSDMVNAFMAGAKEAGHEICTINVVFIMSSGSKFVHDLAIAQYYQSIVEYWGVENAGIFTANGRQNKSAKKRKELYSFCKNL